MVSSGVRAAIGATLLAACSVALVALAGCRGVPATPAIPGVGGAAGAVQQLGPLQRLGQGLGRIRDGLVNRNGNFPGLEKGKRVLSLNDPENLKSDNPAVKTAAEQKQAADEAPQKIKAIKYLGMIGCGCDTSIRDSLEAALDDCDENIRYGACKAFALAAHRKCASCNFKSCCSRKVLDKLWKMGYDRKDSGCYVDPSPKVRSAARQAFKACKKNCFPDDTKKELKPEEGPPEPPAAPAKAPEGKTASTRRIQGSVFHFPGFDWVIEESAPERPMPDFDRKPTLASGMELDADDDPNERPVRPGYDRPQVARPEPVRSELQRFAPSAPLAGASANRPATLEFDEEDAGYSTAMETLTGEKSLAREAAELAAEQEELQVIAARWMADQQRQRTATAESAPSAPAAGRSGPSSVSSERWQAPGAAVQRTSAQGRAYPQAGFEGAAAPQYAPSRGGVSAMTPQQVPYEVPEEEGGVVPASAQAVRRPLPVNAPDPWAAGAWVPPPSPPQRTAGPQYAAPSYAPSTAAAPHVAGSPYAPPHPSVAPQQPAAPMVAMNAPAPSPRPLAPAGGYPLQRPGSASAAQPGSAASGAAGGLSAWGESQSGGPAGLYDPASQLPQSGPR